MSSTTPTASAQPDTEPPFTAPTDTSTKLTTTCHVILYPENHFLGHTLYASRCQVAFIPPLSELSPGDKLLLDANFDTSLETWLDDSLDEAVMSSKDQPPADEKEDTRLFKTPPMQEEVLHVVLEEEGPRVYRALLEEVAGEIGSERIAVDPVFRVRMADWRDANDPNFKSMDFAWARGAK